MVWKWGGGRGQRGVKVGGGWCVGYRGYEVYGRGEGCLHTHTHALQTRLVARLLLRLHWSSS